MHAGMASFLTVDVAVNRLQLEGPGRSGPGGDGLACVRKEKNYCTVHAVKTCTKPLLEDANYNLENNHSTIVLTQCCLELCHFAINYILHCSIRLTLPTYKDFFQVFL